MQCQKTAFRQEKFYLMTKALYDSEEMWKEFRNFSETRIPISTNGDKISATDWKKHFENLHSENRE